MIIGKGTIGKYLVYVHRIASETNEPFVTMYRDKKDFVHHKDWTDDEKAIAEQAIDFTLDHLDLIPEIGLQSVQFKLDPEPR